MYSIKLYLYHYLFIVIKASKAFHQVFNMYSRIKIHYKTHTIKFEEDLPTVNQILDKNKFKNSMTFNNFVKIVLAYLQML